MARRRSQKRKRQASAISSTRSLTRALPRLTSPVVPLGVYEDRRQFHPLSIFRPPARFNGNASVRVVPKSGKMYSSIPAGLRFSVPEKVVICARRQQRREVLFARNKAGKGGMRKRRRTPFSEISCKR